MARESTTRSGQAETAKDAKTPTDLKIQIQSPILASWRLGGFPKLL
jgi:hypothetical protein